MKLNPVPDKGMQKLSKELAKGLKLPKPEPLLSRKFLVTGHIGGRTWVIYHGDNHNRAMSAWSYKSSTYGKGFKTKMWRMIED